MVFMGKVLYVTSILWRELFDLGVICSKQDNRHPSLGPLQRLLQIRLNTRGRNLTVGWQELVLSFSRCFNISTPAVGGNLSDQQHQHDYPAANHLKNVHQNFPKITLSCQSIRTISLLVVSVATGTHRVRCFSVVRVF